MADEQDWEKVLKFFEPKPPLYCPETMSPTQKAFLRYEGMEALFGGSAGGGKACDIRHMIPTPTGFVKMADIHPGDFVLGRDGKPHLVEAESEVMFVPGYRLTFDDGSTVTVNDDHLWLTFDAKELVAITRHDSEWRARRRAQRPSRAKGSQGEAKSKAVADRNAVNPPPTKPVPIGTVRATADIVATMITAKGRRNHAVPVAAPLDLPERDLIVDPYVLGAWLGDGFNDRGAICGADPQVFDEVDAIYERKTTATQSDNFWTVSYDGLADELRAIGVYGNKHIPHEYLWASEAQRLALLQGLMDTDGTVAKNSGSAEFTNTNHALTEGVAHLARSLGMKASVREGRAKLNGKDCGPKWTVKFVANRPVFRLGRKLALQKISTRRTTKFRYIVSAERVDAMPMKCIKVSSPDSLYLVTEHFIPTHNSSALLMAALQYVDVPDYSAILFRRTYADLALPGALMDRFKHWMAPHAEVKWNDSTYTATFPSGARVSFGYLNNVQDYLRYKGAEFQFIGMDEVTEIRESDYKYLFSRMRRPASGPLSQVPLRMRAASNPAPNWVRQHFIVEGREKGRIFVPSKLTDNPGIDADSYRASLANLDPIERKRLEEGNWWVTSLGTMFKRESFLIIDPMEVPEVSSSARAVRFWDMAASEKTDTYQDPDWTVGTLALLDAGVFYVLDVKRFRKKSEDVERIIKQTAEEDGRMVAVRVEREPGSAGKALADQYARYVLPGYDFEAIPSTGDKATRARPMASAASNGLVRLVRSKWLTDWLDEFSSFPEACSHDDQVDSAVGAFNFLHGFGFPQRSKVTIIV